MMCNLIVLALQEQIDHLQDLGIVGGERQDGIDHCLAGISRLSNEVSDASDYVPAYDQRTYAQVLPTTIRPERSLTCVKAIRALAEKLESTRARITPKPKFSFKPQKNGSAISLTDAAELAAQQRLKPPTANSTGPSSNESSISVTPAEAMTPPLTDADTVSDLPIFPKHKDYDLEMDRQPGTAVRKPSFSQANSIKISGHEKLHIILPSSAARATSSGTISNMTRCVVDMSIPTTNGAPFAGLTLRNIKSSLIVAGQVAGAAHITGVENSILVISSRQVRMHECRNVGVYLMCSSRPIIEDCEDIEFAPIPRHYMPILDAEPINMWDQVDDFKWLKAEHSPNWSIVPEDERLHADVWEKVVPGGPSLSTEDILRAVGIKR